MPLIEARLKYQQTKGRTRREIFRPWDVIGQGSHKIVHAKNAENWSLEYLQLVAC